MDFVEELHTWQEIPLAGDEKESGKIRVESDFPDPDGLLDSAYAFLSRLKSPPLDVIVRHGAISCFEEYTLHTAPGRCEIVANDSEGARRGIYKISELLRETTPAQLPVKSENHRPYFRLRISRYRFGSQKYSGMRYELDEDADFYPDAFLDRLASEGVNAVWFNAPSLANFSLSSWHPGDAEKKQKLYAKLQDNVNRCRRYGIRIFPYLVVPEAWAFDAALLEKFPDMAGPDLYGRKLFCPAFTGKDYLHDTFQQLFYAVKNLGGFLAIVQGEGAAVCPELLTYGEIPCQKKCALSPGETFAVLIQAIFDGIRSASSTADLVAWFYLPFVSDPSDYLDEALLLSPKEVVFQYNAESGSSPLQLGRPRSIGDYWQCITEPSPAYRKFAGMATRHGRRLSAKIQVGTSHEVGSVPYVPVPALTYRKYRALQALGTSDVMQTWGTGGTPGMMNFAAGRLAFTDFTKVSEKQFLHDLASTLWGRKLADEVAEAWRVLSDAFQNYPYSNMIQYFGPVADGVNWPLCAYPKRTQLLPTWALNDGKISGDNICECLENHSLDEAVELFLQLSEQWSQGADLFRQIAHRNCLNTIQKREIVRIEALEIHFSTAYRIMRFYQLRREALLLRSPGIVAVMRQLVKEEMQARRKMLALIVVDPVLGYNPEAKGFKYDKDSIERGIVSLEQTLSDLERMEKGDFVPEDNTASYRLDGEIVHCKEFFWTALLDGDTIKIKITCPRRRRILDELFFAFDNDGLDHPAHGHFDSQGRIFVLPKQVKCDISRRDDSWTAELSVPLSSLPGGSLDHCRFNLTRLLDSYQQRCSWPGLVEHYRPARLKMAFYDPQDMGQLLP